MSVEAECESVDPTDLFGEQPLGLPQRAKATSDATASDSHQKN
ncbi:hypothetical protein [Cupriavidus metallidurans]|nr:hypothetical protein [Cupriavidus metallidurans]